MPKVNPMAQIPKSFMLTSQLPDIQDAPCQSTDPDTFFPDEKDYKQITIAKSFCNECDVTTKSNCLTFAIDNSIGYGVWGGKTESERQIIKRRMYRSK